MSLLPSSSYWMFIMVESYTQLSLDRTLLWLHRIFNCLLYCNPYWGSNDQLVHHFIVKIWGAMSCGDCTMQEHPNHMH